MKRYVSLFIILVLSNIPFGANAQQEEGPFGPVTPEQERGGASVLEIDMDQVIVVAGATGMTGRLVVQQLQDLGYTSIRGMTRDKKKAIEAFGEEIEWFESDVRDPESLKAIFAGADKIISTVGSGRTPDSFPEFVDYGGMKNMVDVAKEQGVQKIIMMSAAGASHEDSPLNKILNNIMIWKFKGEQYLRDSGLKYSVVRSGGLPGGIAPGEYGIYLGQGDRRFGGHIAREDIVAVLIECLNNPDTEGKTFEVFNYIARLPNVWRGMFADLIRDSKLSEE